VGSNTEPVDEGEREVLGVRRSLAGAAGAGSGAAAPVARPASTPPPSRATRCHCHYMFRSMLSSTRGRLGASDRTTLMAAARQPPTHVDPPHHHYYSGSSTERKDGQHWGARLPRARFQVGSLVRRQCS